MKAGKLYWLALYDGLRAPDCEVYCTVLKDYIVDGKSLHQNEFI
jgi:hypothetical protein